MPISDSEGNLPGFRGGATIITEHKRSEEELRRSEAQKEAILDASIDRIRLVDKDMRIIWANKTTTKHINMTPEDIVGQLCYRVFHDSNTPCAACPTKKTLKSRKIEHAIMHHHMSKTAEGDSYWDNYAIPIKNESGDIVNIVQIVRNITEKINTKNALTEREKELKEKTNSLEEINIALKVLLKKRDKDKAEFEERVLSNVKELIAPFIKKLKKIPLESKVMTYLQIIESNLNDIISPFLQNLSSAYLKLTPKEIQIANLIKEAKTTKEIAILMNASPRTIETHRKNIRKKMGLNKKNNLRTYLLSFR